jgi:di/tricarboxylate transporter
VTAGIIVLVILVLVTVLLVTEWVPMEATGLLALGAVAVTGLVEPHEAVAGFSNPAVVTIWAVFILSGGLSRTGVASRLGRHVLRLAGRQEWRIVAVVMLSAGAVSSVMNNVAVVVLMLPVVMDLARQTGQPPSRLLMPLAFGTTLGGLTTLIGNSPNLLAADALRGSSAGPLDLFDFAPAGLVALLAGVVFMVLVGRHLLPRRDFSAAGAALPAAGLVAQYQLTERLFLLRVPEGSPVSGKTLAELRIANILEAQVVGVRRDGNSELAPGPQAVLRAGDVLLVRGRQERLQRLAGWRLLADDPEAPTGRELVEEPLELAELQVAVNADLAGKTLRQVSFRQKFGANVLALRRGGLTLEAHVLDTPLQPGDALLVHGPRQVVQKLASDPQLRRARPLPATDLLATYELAERLLSLRVPSGAPLDGQALQAAGLAQAAGLRALVLQRADGTVVMPGPEVTLATGDRLIVLGTRADLELVRALTALPSETAPASVDSALESEQVGLIEAVLAPRSRLAGQRVREAQLRERLGVSLLALWRSGRPYRSQLREMELREGDALLFYGPRNRLHALGREPDFIVLTEAAQELPRTRKAPWALAILGGVLLTAMLGWLPTYLAAVIGAGLMVATGAVRMQEAYRFIEWKAVFLVAGLLPLGTAVANAGAAVWLADTLSASLAPLGPVGMLAALMGVTFLASAVLHPVAVIVMLTPVMLQLASTLGLSPRVVMLGTAVAAASTFMSPWSHPINVMVMGPGGYKVSDFIKVGLPLTLIVWGLTLVVLPWLWPLQAP